MVEKSMIPVNLLFFRAIFDFTWIIGFSTMILGKFVIKMQLIRLFFPANRLRGALQQCNKLISSAIALLIFAFLSVSRYLKFSLSVGESFCKDAAGYKLGASDCDDRVLNEALSNDWLLLIGFVSILIERVYSTAACIEASDVNHLKRTIIAMIQHQLSDMQIHVADFADVANLEWF